MEKKRKTHQSKALLRRAEELMPGGVNSPVRSFAAVGGVPAFIRRARGAHLYDEDGNRYIDYVNAWGAMLLGHAPQVIEKAIEARLSDSICFGAPTRLEVELADQVATLVPSIEQIRMVNSGTEATLSAIRLARGYTKRPKIIKFAGCYHGHADAFLATAEDNTLRSTIPGSLGVPTSSIEDTLIATYNDSSSVEMLFERYPEQIAAIIVEPVAGNMGCIPPIEGFLGSLRRLSQRNGALLIFDEVMTGFRLSLGGAQQVFGVEPDITTLGKVLGGGMPVGAYGGRREMMQLIAPSGPIYQAGTFSGHPLGMAAGLAMLTYLRTEAGLYDRLESSARQLTEGIKMRLSALGIPHLVQRVGSMFTLFFTERQCILIALQRYRLSIRRGMLSSFMHFLRVAFIFRLRLLRQRLSLQL